MADEHAASTERADEPDLPWEKLGGELTAAGWLDLNNRRAEATGQRPRTSPSPAWTTRTRDRDRYDLVAGAGRRRPPTCGIGVVALPRAPRCSSQFAADGYELLLAGHTHGGQLRVPGYGALVTNCGIDRDRVAACLHPQRPRSGDDLLAARLRRPRHLPVRAGPVRLPPRGDPAHADPAAADLQRDRASRTACADPPGYPLGSVRAHQRGVAQLGSALRSGRRGRRFKSCHPDAESAGRRYPVACCCAFFSRPQAGCPLERPAPGAPYVAAAPRRGAAGVTPGRWVAASVRP